MNKTVTVYTIAISKVRKEVENCFFPKETYWAILDRAE